MNVTGSTIQQLEKDKPKSRCRKWRLWATTEQGRKSKRFNGTWTQAQDALKAFVSELEGRVPNSETFGAYAESWRLWRAASGDLSPNTVRDDRTAVRALCRTALAGMRMDAITPDACRDALLWLKSNPVRGGGLKPSTVAKYRSVLNSVMQQAADDGRIAANPVAKVRPPKVRIAERDALSPGEIALFLNRVDDLPLDGRSVALYLMACLGLRCGEACALRDSDVSGGFARVVSTVRGADGSVGPTKSDAGRRTLPVPPRLAAKVDEWRDARDALGLSDAEFLCCNSKGSLMTTASMENWWRDTARSKLGCNGMTLHQLRHSNLSMMARHMGAFDLQRYAGWSSIAPAKVYVHADMDSVSKAVRDAWRASDAPETHQSGNAELLTREFGMA